MLFDQTAFKRRELIQKMQFSLACKIQNWLSNKIYPQLSLYLSGWNIQADPGVQRGVFQQAAGGEVPVQDVPSQHLRGRRHLP